MGMCFNKRVLIGLGVVALAVLAFAPSLLGAVAPLLILAVCPLSMVFMMRAMNRGGTSCGTDQQGAGDAARTATQSVGGEVKLGELEEEVNRLKAELQLRDQQRSN